MLFRSAIMPRPTADTLTPTMKIIMMAMVSLKRSTKRIGRTKLTTVSMIKSILKMTRTTASLRKSTKTKTRTSTKMRTSTKTKTRRTTKRKTITLTATATELKPLLTKHPLTKHPPTRLPPSLTDSDELLTLPYCALSLI